MRTDYTVRIFKKERKKTMNPYIGHSSQLTGAEEYRLVGGKGDGMRLLRVYNGKGVEMTLSLDRCADISRLTFKGGNLGYFSACGYVAPAYYENTPMGFLKSFTAGFLTTCGFNNVGSPNVDEGEQLTLHGTIGNTPCEYAYWEEDEEKIQVHARVIDEGIFARKLRLDRVITLYKMENKIEIADTVTNTGDVEAPLEILYHMNMGYPLLSPESELYIPSANVRPRDARAAEDLDTWNQVIEPQANFAEQCYFHDFEEKGLAAIYSPELDAGLAIHFDTKQLSYFTQWKMMGVRDYVMGLEPGNCHPDGRAKMREEGALDILQPNEKRNFTVTIDLLDGKEAFEAIK